MKSGDIDDLLVNVDENYEGTPATKETLKESSKELSKENESLKEKESVKKTDSVKDSSKEKESLINIAKALASPKVYQASDLAFLENIDSDKSTEEYDEYEKKIKEELSLDRAEVFSEDSGKKEKIQTAGDDTRIKFTKVNFILKGTRTWNTREPYVMPIDYDKLNTDYKDLNRTFYLVKEGENEQKIQGEMKRAMFKFVRNPESNIIQEYIEFINGKLFSLTAELGNYFGFQKDKLHLFVYHLGVLTLYKIIIITFQAVQTGYCFKLFADNNVVKYIPFEFVKEMIFKWHNDNISNNDFPFDGIIEYNDMKRVVSRRYTADYETYNSKLDALISKSNLNISSSDREQIFKSKWDEWFGKTNILIYNRFLERTIFKMVK
jgi:hypothetical protein